MIYPDHCSAIVTLWCHDWHSCGKSPSLMGKSTILTVIFNSLLEGIFKINPSQAFKGCTLHLAQFGCHDMRWAMLQIGRWQCPRHSSPSVQDLMVSWAKHLGPRYFVAVLQQPLRELSYWTWPFTVDLSYWWFFQSKFLVYQRHSFVGWIMLNPSPFF